MRSRLPVKVYRVTTDIEHFQCLTPEDQEIWGTGVLRLCCEPKLSAWQPPAVFSYEPLRKAGDFWSLGLGAVAGFMATPEALTTKWLQMHFEIAGELLPVPFEGRVFKLLNVLTCINCLDQGQSKMKSSVHATPTPLGPRDRRYVFHADRLPEGSIFKIPETYVSEVLTWERDSDPESEFKAAVEAARLTGLIFEKIWSSES